MRVCITSHRIVVKEHTTVQYNIVTILKIKLKIGHVTYVITVHHVIEGFWAGFVDVVKEGRDEA